MPGFIDNYDTALKSFSSEGFYLQPDVWTDQQMQRLLQRSHEWDNYVNKSYLSVMNPHKSDPLFMDALANPNIISILQKMFDGPVSAVQSQFFYGPPGCAGYSHHQDNFFLQADPRFFISVWSSFEKTSAANGGLIVYPKSHVLPILPVTDVPPERRGPGQDPNSDKVECHLPHGNFTAVDIQTKPGMSLFIHANLIHASHSNQTTDRFRHVLLTTYIKTGTPFRSGNYAKREEVPLS